MLEGHLRGSDMWIIRGFGVGSLNLLHLCLDFCGSAEVDDISEDVVARTGWVCAD